MNLKTLKIDEIFRSGVEEYETFAGMIDDDGQIYFTRKESVIAPPNLFIKRGCPQGITGCVSPGPQKVTDFKDPAPQLRGITKQLVKYKRADGVDLSFTLYLPPNYKEGTRLPTIVWAYPESFTDGSVAGQVTVRPTALHRSPEYRTSSCCFRVTRYSTTRRCR
jgi:dipeptidyl aminopeptidase/acylaminoacyl peptidase